MPDCGEWEEKVANLPKAEIKRRGNTDAQVVQKLAEVGVREKERNLCNKLWGGKFTAAFKRQCLSATGTMAWPLEELA